jgi:hypothetical protein
MIEFSRASPADHVAGPDTGYDMAIAGGGLCGFAAAVAAAVAAAGGGATVDPAARGGGSVRRDRRSGTAPVSGGPTSAGRVDPELRLEVPSSPPC